MIAHVESILEDAVKAPSGENCQPWKFKVFDNKVSLINIPEADFSIYNVDQKGSYISHGAVIENIRLSALKYGYKISHILFPSAGDDTHVADIIFEDSEPFVDPLYEAINKRCTNRKDYENEPISINEQEALKSSLSEFPDITVTQVTDQESRKLLGQALSAHEKVLFEHKSMHDFFYDHILWNSKDETKSSGFYIKTLEFLPHQLGAVKVFKNWSLLSVANTLFSVSDKIAYENGVKYASSGTLGALSCAGDTKEDCVRSGIALQRFWLTATNLGLSFHPCNGTLYLKKYIDNKDKSLFSSQHILLIEEAYNALKEGFAVKESSPWFMFRIGKADSPSAISKRLPPSIEYVKE